MNIFQNEIGGSPCQIKGDLNVTTAAMNGRLRTAQGKAVYRCYVPNAAVPISTGPIWGDQDAAGGQVLQAEGKEDRAWGLGPKSNDNTPVIKVMHATRGRMEGGKKGEEP